MSSKPISFDKQAATVSEKVSAVSHEDRLSETPASSSNELASQCSQKTANQRKIYLFKNKTVPKDPYHDLFLSHGFNPIFVPLLRHEFVESENLGCYLRSSEFQDAKNAIIITSQRAIEALNWHLDKLEKSVLDVLLSKPVYTVGPASESALKRWGYKDIRGGSNAGTGLKLSEIILEECTTDQEEDQGKEKFESFIFFTGVTRRDIIPLKLKSASLDIQERVVYKTLPVVNLMDHVLEAITKDEGKSDSASTPYYVFFSPAEADPVTEAVRTLSQSRNVRIAAIGPTTESYLLEREMPPRVVASKPDALHLVKEILEDL